MSIRIMHAADFHLDSPFAGLSGEQAKLRRRESRFLPQRLADYVNQNDIQVVLLAGDLFDGDAVYRETAEQLAGALASMRARVFISPGNHDYYSRHSFYASYELPDNVHVFRSGAVERVELPELSCAVYGAAFTSPTQETSLLEGFSAPDDGMLHLMVLHAELGASVSRYDPITREQIAASRLDYLALGHLHSFDGVHTAGGTAYAYSGCTEGRGFDECGEKGFLCGSVDREQVDIRFVPFSMRRYHSLKADVTDKDPETALLEIMPETALSDLCRIAFVGESDEYGVDIKTLTEEFSRRFYSLTLNDETHIRRDVWDKAQEDSLRGLFLRELRKRYDAAGDGERTEIERAARFGLAALDKRDL
ncbi:MAG: DNA repair exonuclease [Oscillospiraceae bacterium]|nr:DNA repair exonuclease [Oscillospiraceae bacterium]